MQHGILLNKNDSIIRKLALFTCVLGMGTVLSGCELTQNHLKADREEDMSVQDYRDALAPRLPEIEEGAAGRDENVPELKPYVAMPSENTRAMPLVSLSVNQTVPLRDVLYELAEQANYDIELDPRISGSIIFTARNRPLDVVIGRIAEVAGLRYKFDDGMLRVELDTPYHQIYKLNYLSYVRSNQSSITNDVAVVSGEGTDTGSKFQASAVSEVDFWGELNDNLTQILNVNRNAGTLRTQADPQITAAQDQSAPVQPLVVNEDGELIEDPSATPAPAVLRVESLPVNAGADSGAGNQGEDPFAPRFSINRQAGMISVFATERLHKQVKEYLDLLKKSVTSQVLIEAKVLEVSLTDEFSAGIDWSAIDLFGRDMFFGFDVDGAGSLVRGVLDPATDPTSNFSAGYNSGDFDTVINAISRLGTVHALASPRLTVLNNQSAVLNVAKNQVYFEVDVDVTTNADVIQTEFDSEIRNVPEGVLINVQPSIDLDSREISMAVRPTVTRIDGFINDPAVEAQTADLENPIESPVPIVNVQEFDSVIQMNSGQAIVMGGLIQDRTDSTQNAVPVLGEIPMVGGLFRNQQDSITKTELIVLLRATIVEGGNTVTPTDKDLYRTFSNDRRPFDL